jgi:D-alanyl-D-alanine carboxypeptidase (penicillin-binding protein 5/6)
MKNKLLLILLLIPFYVSALTYPKLDSKNVEIYDLSDNKVLYEIDSKSQVSIASLTKIATTITAIENIDDLDKKVTITKTILNTISNEASVAGLKAGDVVTYRDLLYASMVPSGADATNALAILTSGSIDKFVIKMNDLVKRIGLTNTHFVNVTGLDTPNHYSTVDEVRILLTYALKNELFKDIYTTKEYTLSNGLKVKSTIYLYTKGTKLDISPIIGSKTGHTKKAGYVLSSLSDINGHNMIIVTLKATQKGIYYNNIVDNLNLIEFLKNNYQDELLVKKDQVIKTIPVNLSKIDNYEIKASKDIKKFLPSDYDKNKLRIEYNGLEEISFISKKDEKIGTINYYFEDELIGNEDVILNTVIKISIIKVLIHYWYVVLIMIIVVIIILLLPKKKKKA